MEVGGRSRPLQPGAAGVVETTLDAFRNGRLEIAFDFLPPDYQQDINQLVSSAAARVEPEIWLQSTNVLKKAVGVLEQKREIIIPLLAQSGNDHRVEVTNAWDQFVETAKEFVESPLLDQEQVQLIDVRAALQNELGRLIRKLMVLSAVVNPATHNPLRELDEVQVDLVESDGKTARVRIMPRGITDAEPTTFVLRDGKWLPKPLVEAWPATLEAMRSQLQTMTAASGTVEVQQCKDQLKVMDRVLDQMLSAQNVEQLRSAATPLFLQATKWSTIAPAATVPDGPPEGVSMLITRELSDDELTRLLRTLEPLTDDPDREYHLATANGGKTFISIKPVSDITAFAAKLTFASDPTINMEARTITILDIQVP
jgi:hypothetical protein